MSRWHVPTKEEIEFANELLDFHLQSALDDILREFANQTSTLKQEVSVKSEDSQVMRFKHMCSRSLEEQQGVCPYELERGLHELMETREEDEINELKSALEDAKQRLHVKEAEASWWKDIVGTL